MTQSNEPSSPSLYPVFLDLRQKTVLIVGGGNVAARKLARLVETHAKIIVLSPLCHESTQSLVDSHDHCAWAKRWYSFQALEEIQPHLVFACTDDKEVNQNIVEHCQRLGIWVNSATHGHYPADITIPSAFSVADDLLHIALTSENKSPVITKYFRQQLEATLNSPSHARLIRLMDALRSYLKETVEEQTQRHALLETILHHPQLQAQLENMALSESALLDWSKQVLNPKIEEILVAVAT